MRPTHTLDTDLICSTLKLVIHICNSHIEHIPMHAVNLHADHSQLPDFFQVLTFGTNHKQAGKRTTIITYKAIPTNSSLAAQDTVRHWKSHMNP